MGRLFYGVGAVRPQLWVALITIGATLWGTLSVLPPAAVSAYSDNTAAVPAKQLPVGAIGQPTSQQLVAELPPSPVPPASITPTVPPAIDCTVVSCLALTFDDGPNPVTTPQILAILEKEQLPASFFVIGSRIAGHEDLLQRMARDGDEIGNHSWSHPDFTKLPAEQIKQQIADTQAAIVAAGAPAPTLFRPPYGTINQTMRDNIPLSLLLWNEDPKDWAAVRPEEVAAAVEAAAKPGGIVDLHDIYHVTTSALPAIIDTLKGRQFHFVTVSQLLNLSPGSQGEFYGRP